MTYTIRLMGSVPDGGGILPTWPLGFPPQRFVTALEAHDAGHSEVVSMAARGSLATFLVLDPWGHAVDSSGWNLDP